MRRATTPAFLLLAALAAPASVLYAAPDGTAELHLPWREAGLTERQAAAHLLDRFAYGARPGEVDRVLEMGLEAWVEAQLDAAFPEDDLDRRLAPLRTLGMPAREIAETYPNPGLVLIEARREGVIEGFPDPGAAGEGERPEGFEEIRAQVIDYARSRGYRPQRQLLGELMAQKLLRAVYAENQLREVLADFWFNHFNVSLTDREVRTHLLPYEREAIRPHVLGSFREMLEATAKHPAMLLYLDNARSTADEGARVTFERPRGRGGRFGGDRFGRDRMGRDRAGRRAGRGEAEVRELLEARRPRGLNENYARELLELHTLGVDGGYTQDDVVEVARAFTGWTVRPPRSLDPEIDARLARARRFPRTGFVVEGDFVFRADAHDAGAKTVLGRRLPAGRGIEDGLEVLDLVAGHPATAHHLAEKLAVRFVADEPPESLVERLADAYLETGGDLRATVRALAASPELWAPEARGRKIKSPFEVAASALRALDAEVEEPRALLGWIFRMGQPLYAYQAPTGFPDRAEAWVNTGSLLGRMSFGLQLATGRLPGVTFDLLALAGGREPASLDDALRTYLPLLLPERDHEATIERLQPVIHDPELASKVEEASPGEGGDVLAALDDEPLFGRRRGSGAPPLTLTEPTDVGPRPLAHVVGVILGSPEFQRR